MDNGVTAGLNLLNKMMDAEPNGEVKTDKLDVEAALNRDQHHFTHTKHFKITHTHTSEGEMTNDDNEKNQAVTEKTKVKKKKWNCFGGCSGK